MPSLKNPTANATMITQPSPTCFGCEAACCAGTGGAFVGRGGGFTRVTCGGGAARRTGGGGGGGGGVETGGSGGLSGAVQDLAGTSAWLATFAATGMGPEGTDGSPPSLASRS